MTKKLSILLFIATMGAAALAQDAPLYTSETFSLYPRMVVEEKHHADIVAEEMDTVGAGEQIPTVFVRHTGEQYALQLVA